MFCSSDVRNSADEKWLCGQYNIHEEEEEDACEGVECADLWGAHASCFAMRGVRGRRGK